MYKVNIKKRAVIDSMVYSDICNMFWHTTVRGGESLEYKLFS